MCHLQSHHIKDQKDHAQTAEIKDEEQPVTLEHVEGRVEFSHVSFVIEGKEILNDVSFLLPAGKTLWHYGSNRFGKTSLIHLLQRFYDVTDGCIRVDDTDIRKLKLKTAAQQYFCGLAGCISVFRYHRGKHQDGKTKKLEMEEIRNAAEDARAKSFIEKMEEQYDTVIGERGVGLSGGQNSVSALQGHWQTCAGFGAGMIQHPPGYGRPEHEIQKTLNELEDTTKLIIAHRILSGTPWMRSFICRMERSQSAELMRTARKEGTYYQTYLAQYGSYLAEGMTGVTA